MTSAFYVWFYRAFEPGPAFLNAVRFVISLILLLPPTFLMGGTLPVLGRHLGVRQREPGREVGYLYGANTFDGVMGCFFAGFVRLELLGVNGTLFLAGGAAIGIGLLAVWLGRKTGECPAGGRTEGSLHERGQSSRGERFDAERILRESDWQRLCNVVNRRNVPPHPSPLPQGEGMPRPTFGQSRPTQFLELLRTVLPLPRGEGRGEGEGTVVHPAACSTNQASCFLILAAFGVTGFCAMAFQVLWIRILLFLLTTSVYAFSAMLTAFLAGIALGSAFSARFLVPRLRWRVLWFGVIEILVGLAGLISVPVLAELNAIDLRVSGYFRMGGVFQLLLTYLCDTFAVLLVPTFLMGVAFPIVTTGVLRSEPALGRRLGQLYAANTIGCVLGSLLAGAALIPLLGSTGAC